MSDTDHPTTPFPELIAEALGRAVASLGAPEGFRPQVAAATDPRFGDYQSNAAMVLAKPLKRNPREIASELVAEFDAGDLCEEPEVAGPGFINFRITAVALAGRAAAMLDDERLCVPQAAQPKRIVIDYSAPNIAKPMHVGHIRSTIIGDCLKRVARFVGHDVVGDNHIGDWGTQFGMVLYGWKNIIDRERLERAPVEELLRVYQEVNQMQKDDESLREVCKGELVKLQAGDAENVEIWKRCVALSVEGLKRIYAQLGVEFELWNGESFYHDRLPGVVDDLLAGGIARESEGAVAVFSDGSCDPKDDPFLAQRDGEWEDVPFLVRKADGGFGYAASDLATIDYRADELDADEAWYVVGSPQQLHFDQLFATARRRGAQLGLKFVAFGSILGADRKMLRTREGGSVQLADVLSEAVERAAAVVEEKAAELPADERAEIARRIGIGAVKYAELSQHRMTDYIFDWDTMLALKGNTAPYLINAYVRTRAIFRRIEGGGEVTFGGQLELGDAAERALAAKLAQFAEVVPAVLDGFRPNALAQYLYELASSYHRFWEACPVLTSEGVTRHTRLSLCELTSRVLKAGLGLMGITPPERM